MIPWQVWVIIAVILFITEIFTPGFVLACFGIGCLVTGLFSFLGIGLKWQIVIFSITTIVIFFGLIPLVLRYLFPKKYDVKTNIDALIGKSGLVTEKIISHLQTGRVRIGGEDWKAVSLTGSDIEVGQKVTVEQVEGVKVLVRRQN